jgi:hypothetical protein
VLPKGIHHGRKPDKLERPTRKRSRFFYCRNAGTADDVEYHLDLIETKLSRPFLSIATIIYQSTTDGASGVPTRLCVLSVSFLVSIVYSVAVPARLLLYKLYFQARVANFKLD